MPETILEKHQRLMALHDWEGGESCWCNPTWETFPECDGTEVTRLTHHMSLEDS